MDHGPAKPTRGGPDKKEGLFAITRWTVVLGAKNESTQALNTLCIEYRAPLLAWLGCRGVSTADSEDSVQGFFAHLLSHDGLKNVTPEKGRFRTFLLTAFQNYLHDQHKRHIAAKRGGGVTPVSLDETREDAFTVEPPARGIGPDLAYDRAWAEALLSRAMKHLADECHKAGHAALWQALEPVLFQDEDAPAYAVLASRLNITEGSVKVAAHRIRRRLAALIRDEVKQTVATEHELHAELIHFQSLFARHDHGK